MLGRKRGAAEPSAAAASPSPVTGPGALRSPDAAGSPARPGPRRPADAGPVPGGRRPGPARLADTGVIPPAARPGFGRPADAGPVGGATRPGFVSGDPDTDARSGGWRTAAAAAPPAAPPPTRAPASPPDARRTGNWPADDGWRTDTGAGTSWTTTQGWQTRARPDAPPRVSQDRPSGPRPVSARPESGPHEISRGSAASGLTDQRPVPGRRPAGPVPAPGRPVDDGIAGRKKRKEKRAGARAAAASRAAAPAPDRIAAPQSASAAAPPAGTVSPARPEERRAPGARPDVVRPRLARAKSPAVKSAGPKAVTQKAAKPAARPKSRSRRIVRRSVWVIAGVGCVAAGAFGYEYFTASGQPHAISTPQRIGAYVQEPTLATGMGASALRTQIVSKGSGEASHVVDAVYEDSTGAAAKSGPLIILFVGGHLSGSAGSFIGGLTQVAGAFVTGSGSLGGQAACVPGAAGHLTECAWADNDTFGVLASPTLSASALGAELRQMRPALEHPVK